MPDTEDTHGATEDTLRTVSTTTDDDSSEVTDTKGDVTDQDEQDLLEKVIATRLEAETERIRQSLQNEYKEREESERKRREEEQDRLRIANSFGSTVREVRDNLKRMEFWDDSGNRRTFTDQEIEELVVRPMARHNLQAEQSAEYKFRKNLADIALQTIPENKRDDFINNATGKDIKEWLEYLTETKAPSTAYAKKMVKDHEAAVAAAEARALAKAKRNSPPPATVPGEVTPKDSNVDLTTLGGVLRARNESLIDDATFKKKAREFGLFY